MLGVEIVGWVWSVLCFVIGLCVVVLLWVCSVLFSGVAVASEFEPLGTDSMQTVAPAQREDFRPDYFTDDEDFAAVAPADGQWRTRSTDGGRSALYGAGENSEAAEESPRFVPTRLGEDLVIVSTSEMGLIQQMMEDAYASGEPKDHVVSGRMWSDQVDLSVVPDVTVDKHTADVAETQVAVQRQERRACQVLWPTGIEICGAILDKYRQLGWPANWLGWPTEPESVNPDGQGYRQRFATGFIYWHPATGAHAVANITMATWERGGFEAGWLGYPTSDERAITGEVGPGVVEAYGGVQDFQGGQIYRTPVARGAKSAAVTGAILDRWNTLGATGSMLGFPTRDEAKTPDGVGRFSEFEGGSVYWSPATGAWEVPAGIMQKWAQTGYEQGSLGYPVGAPQADGVYRMTQQFQHGILTGYDARIVLLGNLLQLSPPELDEAYNTLLQAFIRDGKDPAQGFVDATNHAIDSYNTTLKLANGENLEDRIADSGPVRHVGISDVLIPRVTITSPEKNCRIGKPGEVTDYGSPGTEQTHPGDVFYSAAIFGGLLNHGHAGIFISGYFPNPSDRWHAGGKTVEAVNKESGVQVLDPRNRKGVCRPILMHVNTDSDTQQRAVEFALSKAETKTPYNSNFLNTRLGTWDRPSYNCIQLVWAAYMKASGGTVDVTDQYLVHDEYTIYPNDLRLSTNTKVYAKQDFRQYGVLPR